MTGKDLGLTIPWSDQDKFPIFIIIIIIIIIIIFESWLTTATSTIIPFFFFIESQWSTPWQGSIKKKLTSY